jgi:hypothetical protein
MGDSIVPRVLEGMNITITSSISGKLFPLPANLDEDTNISEEGCRIPIRECTAVYFGGI